MSTAAESMLIPLHQRLAELLAAYEREVFIARADAYLAGFRDATDGVPFDPFAASAVEELNAQLGAPRGLWLSLIGSTTTKEGTT